ncbi:MAG: threonine aldolase family protein [Bacteroidales bacterium]
MQRNFTKRGFASDNNSGAHPLIIEEILAVNHGHVLGYGADIYTSRAETIFREQFGNETEVYFVFNGTAANVLGISAVTRSWNSIITAFTSHIEQDECGAPEKFTGSKVLTVDTPDGKIKTDMLKKHMHGFDFEHHAQPKIISVTQATEMGTVYTPEEIKDIADFAHKHNMLLHMDGARIANAAVSLNIPFRTFTTDAGVDILSFGGTKNGMIYGEAICFLRPGLAQGFKYIRKQGMQLASKMRFIAAQYIAYFKNDLWYELAAHSNKMAKLLYLKIKDIEGVIITQSVQSNAVFVILPKEAALTLQKEYYFYPWDEFRNEYRLMTSWDTEEEDIEIFVGMMKTVLKS